MIRLGNRSLAIYEDLIRPEFLHLLLNRSFLCFFLALLLVVSRLWTRVNMFTAEFQSREMSTPVAENPLLAPYVSQNPSGSNTPTQGLVHESLTPKDAVDDGSNITAELPQTVTPQTKNSQFPIVGQEGDEAAWGSNFWVTLVDPQVCHSSSGSES
jgi:hypothetical protein